MSLPHPDAVISSPKNPRVRAAAELRERRARDDRGLTLVDGARELGRALAGGARVVEVFADEPSLTPDGSAVLERARAAGAAVVPVTRVVLDRLAYGDRSEGLVATVAVPDLSLAALHLPADPLVIVLEGVEKPGNLGAVLRSADGAGADAVIVADPRTDLFNPNAVRASLGCIFTVPLAAGSSTEVRAHLAAAGLRVLAARVDGVDHLHRRGPARAARDRAGQRGRRPDGRLGGRGRRSRPAADAGRGRQPQRVDRRRRPAVRGPPPARSARGPLTAL